MISISVETSVLRFCLVEPKIGNPRPKYNPPPECSRILGWTANYASTHHFKITLMLELRVRGSVGVPLMYCIKWTTLAQSSSSGVHNLFVKMKWLYRYPVLPVWRHIKALPPYCGIPQLCSDSVSCITS